MTKKKINTWTKAAAFGITIGAATTITPIFAEDLLPQESVECTETNTEDLLNTEVSELEGESVQPEETATDQTAGLTEQAQETTDDEIIVTQSEESLVDSSAANATFTFSDTTADSALEEESIQSEETTADQTASLTEQVQGTVDGEILVTQSEESLVDSSAVDATFTFSDTAIESSSDTSEGFTIDNTILTITQNGTYKITGMCQEGSIVVAKGLDEVTLILENLDLSCSTSAPVVVKKGSTVYVYIQGTVNLTDNEDADTEATNEDFEGACIKVKSNSTLVIDGDGTLNIDASGCKNGIKGASNATVIINGATINVTAANNAIASDGQLFINGGTFNIQSEGDGLKSSPDQEDTESLGTITITDGTFVISSGEDAIQAAGNLTITGGTFTIAAGDDAITSDAVTTIGTKGSDTGPSILVTTCEEGIEGASVFLYSGDATITSNDDSINAANSDLTNYTYTIDISGGTWTLNANGDGLDSNANISMSGGQVILFGPEGGGNSAIDYDGTGTITGGEIFATGYNDMAQTLNGTGLVFQNVSLTKGQTVSIVDNQGQVLFTTTAQKSTNWIYYASDTLSTGQTYTCLIDGQAVGTNTAGQQSSLSPWAMPGQSQGTMPMNPNMDASQPGMMFPDGTFLSQDQMNASAVPPFDQGMPQGSMPMDLDTNTFQPGMMFPDGTFPSQDQMNPSTSPTFDQGMPQGSMPMDPDTESFQPGIMPFSSQEDTEQRTDIEASSQEQPVTVSVYKHAIQEDTTTQLETVLNQIAEQKEVLDKEITSVDTAAQTNDFLFPTATMMGTGLVVSSALVRRKKRKPNVD